MEKISYIIFIPDGKKFHLTPNGVLFSLVGITFVFLFYFATSGAGLAPLGVLFLAVLFPISTIYWFVSFFIYLPLNGILQGQIAFERDRFIIDDEIFELKDMKELDFSFGDFYGQRKSMRANFNPGMSRGVDNHLQFIDNAGQIWIVDFQIQSEHGYLELAPFIKEAVKANKMPIQRGIDLVGRENITI